MMTEWFLPVAGGLAVVAGATASVVGFGIGSLLTPFVAWQLGTETAVAVIALPHLAGSLLRGWRLRSQVDRGLLIRFGALSAVGGLAGALMFGALAPNVLGRVLGGLLVLTAMAGLTQWAQRWTPRGGLVWVVGALSGFFGGVVGNQGGLRAAALSPFGLQPAAFVATSTVVGIVIDLVRTPVYLTRSSDSLPGRGMLVGVLIGGVLIGTLAGERLLLGLSATRFRILISVAVGVLGCWFLIAPR